MTRFLDHILAHLVKVDFWILDRHYDPDDGGLFIYPE